jgi:hypothetical protein
VRHVATALVLPPGAAADTALADLAEELDPEIRRRSELAAEEVVLAFETARLETTVCLGDLIEGDPLGDGRPDGTSCQ